MNRAFSGVRNYGSARVTTLSNGVRVATQATKDHVATVGAYMDAGTRDETSATEGTSQIIASLARQPRQSLAELATSVNAKVERERTSYTIKVMPENVGTAVNELGNIVYGRDNGNFEAAKQAVLNSVDEQQSIQELIMDRAHMSTFRDSPLGNSLLGPLENTGNLTEDELVQFRAANYSADRLVVTAAGNVDHDSFVRDVERNFEIAPQPKASIMEHPYFCGTMMVYRNDEMGPTLYFALGYEGVPFKHPDALTFEVMKYVIGGMKNNDNKLLPGSLSGNRTVNRVANKMNVGCADEFQAFNINYRDTGFFGTYCACDEIAAENATGEMQFGVNMLSGGVVDEEVARAKREFLMDLHSSRVGTKQLADHLEFNRMEQSCITRRNGCPS